MAQIYKCKCGAPLEVSPDGKTGICPYCGEEVVFPKAGFQRMNKANELRQRREFDQAEGIYRALTIAFPDDPEIWWNIVLCEYGIEYVEETREGKKRMVPTINRMKYESIFELDAYKKAIEFADDTTKEIYRQDAQAIEDIQIRFQEVVAKEEKYDVFISFKDKDDETGERTLDSALAQEIYDALTKEGYKVFFSRITLRRAIGQEFEPKIFAALNSAAMMLLVTCKKEHAEATWVKNEWSRYLKLMEKDANKYLLPIYADMKPEELPDAVSSMEGIEVNGANYMNLILKNVGQRIGFKKQQRVDEKIVQDIAILEKDEVRRITDRGYNAFRSGRWEQAENYVEEALDIDVTYAAAWWGKLSVLTKDFTLVCDLLGDAERKRCYDTAKKYASGDEWKMFEKDIARLEKAHRKEQMNILLNEFMEKTKNMGTVWCDNSEDNNKMHESLIQMQKNILALCDDAEEKESLTKKFDHYNHKRERVSGLKREYTAIEAVNEEIEKDIEWIRNNIYERQGKYDAAKSMYGMKLRYIGLAICVPNAIPLIISDDNPVALIFTVILLFLVYRQQKKRDKYVGGSMKETKKFLEDKRKVLAQEEQKGRARIEELRILYPDLKKRYDDVKSYIIPTDLNAHIAEWQKKMGV